MHRMVARRRLEAGRRPRRLAALATSGLLLLYAARLDAQSEMFKWTDENGRIHFSNSAPPVGVDAAVTKSGSEFQPVPLESDPERPRKLVRVQMSGSRDTAEVRMTVDTGAQVTMIDEELANQIGVRWMRRELVGGVTGVGVAARVEVPSLRIGGAELRDVSMVVSPGRGMRLLGLDILDRLDLSVGRDSLYRSSR